MSLSLEQKIEAVLLFKNEPVSLKELSKVLETSLAEIKSSINKLEDSFSGRGMILLIDDEYVSLGTHPEASELIEKVQKEELSRDIGRAGLETLSIILYKGPISRREIDFIRGVNSNFILRNLLIRGLVERVESREGERSFSYKPTLELLRLLGVSKREDLPEYKTAFQKLESFAKSESTERDE